uniref:Uncharacterized protein n=1 Tax=candidate division WOR-3 bacterium TaxID=2052148 RepID=A0A7C3YSK9_UNCW3
MTEETKNNDDIKRLELAHKIREFHHNSLWEEEKHFTWLVSIVLSAQIIVYTSNSLCNQDKLIFVLVGSLIGIFLCITAYRTLRKEGAFFHTALSKFVEEYNAIYVTSPLPKVPEKANKDISELIKLFFTGKVGVRDCFQLLFLFFMLIFVFISVYGFLTLGN